MYLEAEFENDDDDDDDDDDVEYAMVVFITFSKDFQIIHEERCLGTIARNFKPHPMSLMSDERGASAMQKKVASGNPLGRYHY